VPAIIERHGNVGFFDLQNLGERNRGELLALISIKYIWLSMPGKRLLNSFNAEAYLQGDGKSPL